jgi:hypothetical protein
VAQYKESIVLIIAVCCAVWIFGVGSRVKENSAGTRFSNISSVTGKRGVVADREKTLYPAIDKSIADGDAKRAKIKIEEVKPPPTRKETASEIQNVTKGDICTLAHMFVLSGYTCSVR